MLALAEVIVILLTLRQIQSGMKALIANIKISINEKSYLIDPYSTKLGKNILCHSIDMIDKLGFEKFTFKKLGEKIDSPEASIYRYFKNKNQLLSYLISWYWGWMEYRLVFETANVASARVRLERAIALIGSGIGDVKVHDGMDMQKLNQIVIAESSKSYLTKEVDKANKEGAFYNYKQFVLRVVEIVKENNAAYKYPNMLVSTVIEGAHLQFFFAEHLPRLTNKQRSKNYITDFYTALVFSSINVK